MDIERRILEIVQKARNETEINLEFDKLQAELQAQIDALNNDPKTVERLTREKLGYAKPDETVVRFESATNAPAR